MMTMLYKKAIELPEEKKTAEVKAMIETYNKQVFQVEKYGEKKAVLINGIEWGIVHLPLIYFGFNYS